MSAIAEVVAHHAPVPMEFVGIMDSFGDSGDPEALMEQFHLTDVEIAEAVERVITRKTVKREPNISKYHVFRMRFK